MYILLIFFLFLGADASTSLNDVHYAGSIFVFARGKSVKCISCKDDSKIRGFVDITTAMLNLGYVTYPEVHYFIHKFWYGMNGKLILSQISANLSTEPELNVSVSPSDINLVYVSSDGHTQLPPPPTPPTIVVCYFYIFIK